MSINVNCTIQKNPDVNFTTVDNDIIIMSPRDQGYYRLNAVGASIWNLLGSSSLSLLAIAESLQNSYPITKEQALDDTWKFIEMMVAKGIFSIDG